MKNIDEQIHELVLDIRIAEGGQRDAPNASIVSRHLRKIDEAESKIQALIADQCRLAEKKARIDELNRAYIGYIEDYLDFEAWLDARLETLESEAE